MSDAEVISKFRDMAMSDRTDVISREVAYIPDGNGSAYNGQITFDLSSLGQTNKWLSYAEAYIEIPYVIAARSTVATTDNIVDFIGMKDGFHQLIDSISVEFNQKQAIQVQNFTNIHTQFKLLTSSSVNDVSKNRATNGFYGDDVKGLTYQAASNAVGIGYCNSTDTANNVFVTRKQETTSVNVPAITLNTINKSKIMDSGRSYYNKTSATDASRIHYWVVMATIRLSDISDLFAKIPLCKTTDVRLNIVYNSSEVVINIGAAPTTYALTSYQQVSGHCCPFMVNPEDVLTAQIVTIKSNVMKSGLGEVPKTAITSCRLYVPSYKLQDSISMAMIQSFPTTTVEYNDIYTYPLQLVVGGSTFSHTLTTGVVNPQYVVVIPFPKTNTLAGLNCATYQSIFDSAPGTTSAIMINDFNVMLGGLNVFNANQRYDYEQFIHELSKINCINGNNTLGLTSGVLNYYQFQQGYRMYVADLSRREPSADNVTKSIVITGTNTLDIEIELICFVAYKKRLDIQTSTGLIKE